MVYREPLEHIFESGEENMEFEQVVQLARDTPTSVLCEALGANAREVMSLRNGERPMTIREAGALADVHGMQLLDVLTV